MRLVQSVFSKLLRGFIVLDTLGALIALIWLLLSGGWRVVVLGFVFIFVMPKVFGLCLLPSILVTSWLLRDNWHGTSWKMKFTACLSCSYLWMLISFWCCLVLYYTFRLGIRFALNPVPSLLWGFVVATGPLVSMAYDDARSGNTASLFTAFGAQLAFVLSIVAIIVTQSLLCPAIVTYTVIGVVEILIMLKYVSQEEHDEELYNAKDEFFRTNKDSLISAPSAGETKTDQQDTYEAAAFPTKDDIVASPWKIIWIYVITPLILIPLTWMSLRGMFGAPAEYIPVAMMWKICLLEILVGYGASILPATWIRFVFKKAPINSALTRYFVMIGCTLLSWPIYYFVSWFLFGEGTPYLPGYIAMINIFLILGYGRSPASVDDSLRHLTTGGRAGVVCITLLGMAFCLAVAGLDLKQIGGRAVTFGFIFYCMLTDRTERADKRGYEAEPFAAKREEPVASVPFSPPTSGKAIIPPWEQDQ